MLERGTIVAGYRVDGVLGDGGMGMVYRATQLSLDREVALKLLSSDLGDDSGFRTRFQREGQLQAALDDEHIVPVFEAGQSEHGLFLAMRLIDGPTLKDLILAGELDPRRSLRLLAQVAHALDTAHAAGLIHRDIKPQNILIDRGDHAYLADFGLIKAPDEAARLTGTGQFIGTIDYVAPEQIQGDPASAASDIYALAGVLYETLTGEVPFLRPNEAATLHSHVIAPPPRVTERRPDLPATIDEVIARGMAKDPAARPPSATELVVAASRALSSSSVFGAAVAGAGPAAGQATVVRERPMISPTASTPALDRADDGAVSSVPEPIPAAPVAAALEASAVAEPEVAEPDVVPEVAEPEPVAEPEVAEPAAVEPGVAEPAAAEPAPKPLAPEPEPVAPAREEPAPAPVARHPRRALWALVLVAAAAAAGVGGYLIGHSRRHARTTTTPAAIAFTSSAAVNHVQLRYPAPWQLDGATAVVPGMSFDAPLVLSRPGRPGQLVAGTVAAAAGPTLLSPSFRSHILGALPRPDHIRLGTAAAYRYAGLHVSGVSGPLDVYAVPTTAGTATVVCEHPATPDRAFSSDCARIAATLRLIGTAPYPLGPSPAFASLLSATFVRLHSDVHGPLVALHAATTASAQAAATQRLSGAYGAAADRLSGTAVSPFVSTERDALVGALRRCASAYGQAASAARAAAAVPDVNATIYNVQRERAAVAYRSAERAVAGASAALSQALRGLSALGYTVVGQR